MTASIETYRNVSQGTESPRRTVMKCLEASGRFLAEAEDDFRTGRSALESLGKARTVIGGLMCALDFETGEMARNLLRLYLFVLDRVQSAVVSGRDPGLAEARRVLDLLREGWDGIPADAGQAGHGSARAHGLDLRG